MTSVTFDPPRDSAGAKRSRRRAPVSRSGPPPRPFLGQVALVVVLGGLIAVVVSGLANGSGIIGRGSGAVLEGNLTGLVGTYLALVMVLLISRIPPIERILGQDGLVRWHRRLAVWPLSLIGLHAVFTTVGYAESARSGIWHEIGSLLGSYPNVLAATVGLGLMALAGVTSIRAVRNRLRRETWWVIHLYLYLALVLSFPHVLGLGQSFVHHSLARIVWTLAWVAAAGSILTYRVALPLVRSLRHQLVVTEVRREAPGISSIICSGRHLDRLAVSGGQFVQWRFLQRGLWWQAHPYSLSALPRPPYLRLTVKTVGDHSAAVARLRPGTRVLLEGPYGAFTRYARRRRRSLLVAGGIGLTAVRSLLEDLPRGSAPEVVVRVSSPEDFVFRSEVVELVRHRKGQVHEVVGTRGQVRFDAKVLAHLVPDAARRDIYVCGPEGFVDHVVDMAERLGVHREAIHYEIYGF